MTLAANHPDRAESVLTAMLAAKRKDLASAAIHIFGSVKVLRTICNWASGTSMETHAETLSAWLAASVIDGEALAEVLSSDCVPDRALLLMIARRTSPDFVPNNYGEDPWWTSVSHAKGNLEELARQYQSAYLLARALWFRSRNQAELIEFAFDDVYLPALRSRLSSEAWAILEPRLPQRWFFDWDYCQRLRDALVDVFVERDLSPITFTRVTRDDYVFEELARAVARTGRGRRFLKKTLQALMNQNQWSARRVKVLRDVI